MLHEHSGREDLEVRALLRHAGARSADFSRSTTPPRLLPDREQGRRWPVALIAIPVLVLPLRMALAEPSHAETGRIWDAAAFVETDAPVSAGRFLVATVRTTAVDDGGEAANEMDQSQRNAVAAALACTAASPRTSITLRSQGVGGPSAGLMLGLAIVDELDDADLTQGRYAAGTGTLSPGGRVGAVGAIAEKAVAAERAGADLFFVPIGQVAEAEHATNDLEVVGVHDLNDAVRFLSGSSCRAPLRAPLR